MELINQHTKKIMEECKTKAREVGLKFDDETLEYIVTNRDLLELTPKIMIPTLYDYWVHDVYVLQEKGRYEVYPSNPYETVINTRPAISFYNDNNPDWLNVMIFYHVLAHIDFNQNNAFFKNTWGDDFNGKALADKRLITKLRSEKGRWVDYVIEFTRGIDNLVGFYNELTVSNYPETLSESKKVDFYFDVFLQRIKKVNMSKYLEEIKRYNKTIKEFPETGETIFFSQTIKKYPEFESIFEKEKNKIKNTKKDLIQYIDENSEFLNKNKNEWMKSAMHIVRDTSLYFQPQIRDKIANEGWASYWHEKLFLQDDRMKGHEVDFAKVNAEVMSLSRVGLNPYALGWRLLMHAEELAERGKISYDFQKITNTKEREKYNKKTGEGKDFLFKIRENFNDFMLINTFVDQDFVDKYKLFVVGRRYKPFQGVVEFYIRSKKAEDYKKMLLEQLYHPPHITVEEDKAKGKELYLNHHFEDKPLVKEFIPMTMIGIEYFWGYPIKLETSEIGEKEMERLQREIAIEIMSEGMIDIDDFLIKQDIKYQRVLYTMKNRKLSKEYLDKIDLKKVWGYGI